MVLQHLCKQIHSNHCQCQWTSTSHLAVILHGHQHIGLSGTSWNHCKKTGFPPYQLFYLKLSRWWTWCFLIQCSILVSIEFYIDRVLILHWCNLQACFRPLSDASTFIILYMVTSVYFSGVMVWFYPLDLVSGHKIMKLLDWCKLSIVEDMGS